MAGQYWAQMMAVGIDRGLSWINFWSVIEGADLAYISSAGTKKPTYQHMLEFAKYYDASAISTASPINYLGTTNDSNLKAFGVYNTNQIAVFILNMDSNKNTAKIYNVNLNGTSQSNTWAKVNMGLSGSGNYTDTIYGQSSTVILYDCGGFVSKKYRYELKDSLNPWKSVSPAVGSPATIYSVTISADYTLCCPGCTHDFTATPSPNTGTHTYDWFKNGSIVQSGSSNIYTASGSASTTNTISVTMYSSGCAAKASAKLRVNNGPNCNGPSGRMMSGTETVDASAKHEDGTSLFLLIPNPAMNRVSVNYSLNDAEVGEMIVLNAYGAQIGKYKLSSKKDEVEIDCTAWAAGIYTAIFTINGQKRNTEKLIITK